MTQTNTITNTDTNTGASTSIVTVLMLCEYYAQFILSLYWTVLYCAYFSVLYRTISYSALRGCTMLKLGQCYTAPIL